MKIIFKSRHHEEVAQIDIEGLAWIDGNQLKTAVGDVLAHFDPSLNCWVVPGESAGFTEIRLAPR